MKVIIGSGLFVALAASVAFACSALPFEDDETSVSEVNGVPVGEVKGVLDISNTIRTRLFDDTDTYTAGFDISRVAGDSLFALRGHLGTFAQVGATTEYQGGLPTPFSATLWHQVFARLSDALGARCGATNPLGVFLPAYTRTGIGGSTPGLTFKLTPAVAAKLDAACSFEGDESARRAAAVGVFDTIMGRGGALAAERAAFESELGSEPEYAAMSPKERVASMALALFLNPHFLLAN